MANAIKPPKKSNKPAQQNKRKNNYSMLNNEESGMSLLGMVSSMQEALPYHDDDGSDKDDEDFSGNNVAINTLLQMSQLSQVAETQNENINNMNDRNKTNVVTNVDGGNHNVFSWNENKTAEEWRTLLRELFTAKEWNWILKWKTFDDEPCTFETSFAQLKQYISQHYTRLNEIYQACIQIKRCIAIALGLEVVKDWIFVIQITKCNPNNLSKTDVKLIKKLMKRHNGYVERINELYDNIIEENKDKKITMHKIVFRNPSSKTQLERRQHFNNNAMDSSSLVPLEEENTNKRLRKEIDAHN